MSFHDQYHAAGYQQHDDPNQTQPGLRPPPPANASPYTQGSPYGQHPPDPQRSQYSGAQAGPPPIQNGQEQSYFPSHIQYGGADGGMGGLSAQMGQMDVGGGADGVPASRPGKKKNRHAYHNLDQPAASAGTYGGPMGGYGQAPQSVQSQQQPGTPGYAHPYAGQAITPAMNQFPAPSQGGQPFSPGLQAAGSGPNVGQAMRGPPMPPASSLTEVSTQGRVDPEQIPSVPLSRDSAARYYTEHVYQTMEQHLPPNAAVPYVAYDQGNSSPKHSRLTLNNIPSSSEALATTSLPLGLVLQPLAKPSDGEADIPVLDFGDIGPPRCRRCRAYVNPFMTFRSGGNKLVCNMCTHPNDVSPDYFAPTDPTGVRVDRMQRPELCQGTVEFMVPREYWAKEPVGLRWLFLMDVSQEAVNRGLLFSFCQGVLEALYGGIGEEQDGATTNGDVADHSRRIPPRSKVGFVTYDRAVHYFNCSAKLSEAQMLVMPDVEEPFVPLGSDGLLVDPYESRAIITSLLQRLPDLYSQVKMPEPAVLPALDSAVAALSTTGGKIVCSLSALPSWGPGALFRRDDGKLHGIETEKKLFQTENPNWKKTASKMVESGVGVDFFITSASGAYMDIATVGHCAAQTGGEIFFYPNFVVPRDQTKLAQELKHALTRATGYQALMKVRCSNGLQVSSYHGNFLQHTFGADLEFGIIDEDKAVGVLFSYDGKLDSKLDAHFQCALLYTTAGGERRVRCTNTVASVSEGASMEGMRYIDQDAIVSMVAREAATRMTERPLKDIRNAITEKTVDILAGYRKGFSGNHPPGQLVLPENLKEFSMYTLGLLKSRAFKAGSESSDRRTHAMRFLKSASPLEISLYLYPRIIAVHNLAPTDGFPHQETGHLQVPSCLRASFSRIEEGGAYLVDDGQICLLWLHKSVSPNLLEDLFGEGYTSLQSLDPMLSTLPILETHLNCQVRNLVSYWSSLRGSKALTLQLARQGIDGSEFEFARLLVEDRNNEASSYVDWLVHVHRAIQMELAGQRRKEGAGDGAEGQGMVEGMMEGVRNLKAPW